jgi:hypothetical protein
MIRFIEEREMPVCLSISRGDLYVKSKSSWLQINSETVKIFVVF